MRVSTQVGAHLLPDSAHYSQPKNLLRKMRWLVQLVYQRGARLFKQIYLTACQILSVHALVNRSDICFSHSRWLLENAPRLGESRDRWRCEKESGIATTEQLAFVWIHTEFHDWLVWSFNNRQLDPSDTSVYDWGHFDRQVRLLTTGPGCLDPQKDHLYWSQELKWAHRTTS